MRLTIGHHFDTWYFFQFVFILRQRHSDTLEYYSSFWHLHLLAGLPSFGLIAVLANFSKTCSPERAEYARGFWNVNGL